MLRTASLIALVVTLSGCGRSEGVDCTARMVWDGVVYEGVGEPADPPDLGRELGTGYTLGCPTGDRDQQVAVFAVVGADPADAIIAVGDAGWPNARMIWSGPGRAYAEAIRSRRHPFLESRSRGEESE